MKSQLIIRIDPEIKNRLDILARREGKSNSQLVRELITNYLQERDMAGYVDDLWQRMGKKFKTRGISESDIESAIQRARDASE